MNEKIWETGQGLGQVEVQPPREEQRGPAKLRENGAGGGPIKCRGQEAGECWVCGGNREGTGLVAPEEKGDWWTRRDTSLWAHTFLQELGMVVRGRRHVKARKRELTQSLGVLTRRGGSNCPEAAMERKGALMSAPPSFWRGCRPAASGRLRQWTGWWSQTDLDLTSQISHC